MIVPSTKTSARWIIQKAMARETDEELTSTINLKPKKLRLT